jgi:hypothetical protein
MDCNNYENIDKSLIEYDTIPEDSDELFFNRTKLIQDLPIEFSIIENDLTSTYINLFEYFKKDYLIGMLSEPFYSDYVFCYSCKALNIINTKKICEEIKEKVGLIK